LCFMGVYRQFKRPVDETVRAPVKPVDVDDRLLDRLTVDARLGAQTGP
jgi:hypothetical protein